MGEANKFNFIFEDGRNLFFTSDTHFHHENIIRFCNRPFENVEDMDNQLVANWNSVVPWDGIVFHLGDFAWGGYQAWKHVRERLNGKIILIKGNHDEKNLTVKGESDLFSLVAYQLKLRIENRPIYLNHYPFLTYAGVYRNEKDMVWQAYGHVHSGELSNAGKDFSRLAMCYPTQYDVGVDNNGFRPISWDELNTIISRQVAEQKKDNDFKEESENGEDSVTL